jgi:hypothetical protein
VDRLSGWSKWRKFPDPRDKGVLIAPFGPGCYELRNGDQLVLYGMGGNVAYRMSSLLPEGLGCGTRNNNQKREYVLSHLEEIEYRTLASATKVEAKVCEQEMWHRRSEYLFQT